MADENILITLKILSPSTEVNGDILFRELPAVITVKDLKLRIQNEIASRPAIDRMRLIYRGRVLPRETDTMIDVFGIENVRSSPDHSLHLVLRELHHSDSPSLPSSRIATPPAPRSSTAPPQNPFRETPPTPQTNPFRTLPQPRPNSQPQLPHGHHHHHHHIPGANPFVPLPVPPVVNNILQQQIAQAMAAHAAHDAPLQWIPQPQASGAVPDNTQTPAPTLPTGEGNSQNGHEQPQSETQGSAPTARGSDGASISAGVRPQSAQGSSSLPPQATRTIRHEAIGPNGQRWSMTINSGNITIPVQPVNPHLQHQQFQNQRIQDQQRHNQHLQEFARSFPVPPQFQPPLIRQGSPLSTFMDRELRRVQLAVEAAQREMENVRILIQEANNTNPAPTWRYDEIQQHVGNLLRSMDQMQVGLSSLAAEPDLARNRTVVSLQMLNSGLRTETANLVELINQRFHPRPSDSSSGETPAPSTNPTLAHLQTQGRGIPIRNSPSVFGPELFVLSSPSGPVGILYDERGTYRTAPFMPSLPLQAFDQQFAANRQVLAAVGQQMAHFQTQAVAPINSMPGQAAQPAQEVAQPVGAAAPPPAQPVVPEQQLQQQQDRVGVIMGHAWLLFKLIMFIYFFAGGGTLYRPILMGVVGGMIYLAQLGIFEDQFDHIRRHFEALVGLGDGNPAAPNAQGVAAPNPNPTPEEAAQRMVRQHEDRRVTRLRETVRSMERAFALFVASLWPGLGERMVQAQEERVRAARAAEEEASRVEEERLAKEQEEKEKAEKEAEQAIGEEKAGLGAPEEGESSNAKGKERAVDVIDESVAAGSSAGSSAGVGPSSA